MQEGRLFQEGETKRSQTFSPLRDACVSQEGSIAASMEACDTVGRRGSHPLVVLAEALAMGTVFDFRSHLSQRGQRPGLLVGYLPPYLSPEQHLLSVLGDLLLPLEGPGARPSVPPLQVGEEQLWSLI